MRWSGESPAPEPRMERHVYLLARLYRIWGALAMVAGVAILVQGLGALAVVLAAEAGSPQTGVAAWLTATLYFLFALGALAWGGVHWSTATGLRRRRLWARLVGLLLAVLNLFFLPFGTALAAYAFWVLMSDETRTAFAPSP
jgi:hypothetical protein